MLRHLLQPHAMTYISSQPELFYKKVILKVSKNSQENSCAQVSFSRIFNKNEVLAQGVFVNFANLVWRQNTKGECLQMFPKKVYICFVYI